MEIAFKPVYAHDATEDFYTECRFSLPFPSYLREASVMLSGLDTAINVSVLYW
jgi:hypothetical protein